MSVRFATCSLPMLPGLHAPTSSPESADGTLPCKSPAGPLPSPCGPVPAHANPSLPPDAAPDSMMPATSGLSSSASLTPADLFGSLGSRLQADPALRGGILYRLTWEVRVTPSGRRISALRASAHPTSASDSSGWPTVLVNDSGGSQYCYKNGDHSKRVLKLPGTAQLTGWPTTTVSDGTGAQDSAKTGGESLRQAVGWTTPTARDSKDGAAEGTVETKALLGRQVWQTRGQTPSGPSAVTDEPGRLNPEFTRWLQGYPSGWGRLLATGTASSRKSRRPSSALPPDAPDSP